MELKLYGRQLWLSKCAVDFRMSIDGLSHRVVSEFNLNPREGIFIFYNRSRDKLKCLSWHRNGFILIYKRLEAGKFDVMFKKPKGTMEIKLEELGWLLAGLPWQQMSDWRELDYKKFS